MKFSCEKRLKAISMNCVAGCYLLFGEKGLGKKQAGKMLASKFLGTKSENNPDYLSIFSEKGLIGVDMIDSVREFLFYLPVQSKMRVCVINDAELMTVSAQNALLKVLEELPQKTSVFLIANSELLPTIHSRSVEIRFKPLSYKELCQLYPDKDNLLLYLVGGKVGYIGIYENSEFLSICKNVLAAITDRNAEKILGSLNLLKEKDKYCFFEAFQREDILCFLQLLKRFLIDVMVENKLTTYHKEELIVLHDSVCVAETRMKRKGQFTKNDFFDLMRGFC